MEIKFYVDDGSRHDLRVAELLERYNYTGIFYIAPMNPSIEILLPLEIKEVSKKHEIGCHTLTHKVLTKLPVPEQVNEMMWGREYLEEITEKSCHRFAPPRGWYNDETITIAKQCGFSEFRTMKQGSTDYFGENFVVPITVHFHPNHYQKWKELYHEAVEKDGYFGVTCHGWELEKFSLWKEYEAMLKYIYEHQNT